MLVLLMTNFYSEQAAASNYALSSSTSGGSETIRSDEFSEPRKRKGRKRHLMNQRLASALDTYRITDRAAFHVITAVLKALDLPIDDFVLSRDTIRTARKEERRKTASTKKKNLKVSQRKS